MGWRNRVISATDDLLKYATHARELVADGASDKDGTYDIDEVACALLDSIAASHSALAELYDSCGPFFQRKGEAGGSLGAAKNLARAAKEASECKEGADEGPCSACLEQLDGAVERFDLSVKESKSSS
jgi:hypothetical protein